MNHEAHPWCLWLRGPRAHPRRFFSWLKETAGPSAGARRLYESLVTVLRRGDLLGFKINGADFAILASRIFAALTSVRVRDRCEWRMKRGDSGFRWDREGGNKGHRTDVGMKITGTGGRERESWKERMIKGRKTWKMESEQRGKRDINRGESGLVGWNCIEKMKKKERLVE